MNKANRLLDIIHSAGAGLVLTSLCFALQYGSTLFSLAIQQKVAFQRVGALAWRADISNLKPGDYYVSIGRPRGGCILSADNNVIASNQGASSDLRSSLLLGGPLAISATNHPHQIVIACAPQVGFSVGFTHDPIIAEYRAGLLLQLWRAITELLMGPVLSLLLLALVLFQARTYLNKASSPNQSLYTSQNLASWPHAFFAIVAFMYSLSLAHYPRLFLSSFESTAIHVFLRNIFSISTLLIFGSYSKQSLISLAIHACALLSAVLITIVQPDMLNPFYVRQYVLFPVTTIIATYRLFKTEAKSESVILLRYLGVAWTIGQLLDTKSNWIVFGAYIAPSMLALMIGIIGYIKYNERLRSERIEITTARILAAIESKSPVREALAQIALITSNETHFARISAYIDGFCLGYSDQPRKVFVRVMESGYKKNTTKDAQVLLEDGRGGFMAEATSSEQLVLRKGAHDNAFFIVIPLGKHAVLNLSDDKPVSPYSAYESEEILRRLHPALHTLNNRLIDDSLRHGFALERLRSIKGDGRFDCEIGSIFADINDYSHYTERYGTTFSDFISAVYFPALIKALSKWAVPEFVRGDEIYLVSIKELIPDDITTKCATIESLATLQDFILNEGANLCAQNGYAPLKMSIGATVGVSTVICDPIKVRTAGQSINEAKRLQEAAGHSGILVKSTMANDCRGRFLVGEDTPILVKKNFIMATPLIKPRSQNAA